ncbi:hypothetical protein ABZ135_23475 [Streptomyces sp. NPDC006339]|uniref:hypothetical protein n=1 Tax=Streptomyces sp. NPDC006339 TaxID=3156755 RepID=UPI0033A60A9C
MSTHPDLPDTLVHFTGRPRSPRDLPPDFAEGSAEDRLVSILQGGALRGAPVFGADAPVLCFSEASEEARRVMLRDGAGARRPYDPWGLVLDRRQLVEAGARPVLHVSYEERAVMQASLSPKTYNRCVAYEPGRVDWLHEREWRLCFEAAEEPELSIRPRLVVDVGTVSTAPPLVVGVIVGTPGWTPPPRYRSYEEARAELDLVVRLVHSAMETSGYQGSGIPLIAYGVQFARPANGLARWYWNGTELVPDGVIDIQAQEWATTQNWGGTLPGLSYTITPETDREELRGDGRI